MKRILFFLAVIAVTSGAVAQTRHSALYELVEAKRIAGAALISLPLFSRSWQSAVDNSIVSDFINLDVDRAAALNIYSSKPGLISIRIPFSRGDFLLYLAEQPINEAGNFSFGIIENGERKKITVNQGLHYRGYVEGDPSSMACISIFDNGEMMGVFANKEGNYNIGRVDNGRGGYVVYNSGRMVHPPQTPCATSEIPAGENAVNNTIAVSSSLPANPLDAPTLLCNKVRNYWEADYKLYANNFSSNLTNTKNYLTGLFNVMSSVYQNEGIKVELSSTYVWTTPDPYTQTNSTSALNTFKARWNSLGNNFNADYAHLIAGAPTNNGGIAFLLINDQCNRAYAYAYSNVYANYQAYPAYSWDVEVVSHETGHLFGSHHTHWCGWNTGPSGTCGSIDNCAAQEASTCSTCPTTTNINSLPPGFQGSIMSYCYLLSGVGVNLANGFGQLPQATIRGCINAATCLTQGSKWTGTASTAWENPANWSCGTIPTATTDITIGTGLSNYPIVNSAATCRSISQPAGTTVRVNSGSLKLWGLPNN